MSVALNSFKLLPLLQLDVGMKPFVQSGVFTETSQNELVAAAAHHAVPCSLRIARWGSAASRARLVARMRWYGARVCCPGRPPVSCAPSVTITESTDRIAHFSGLASAKKGANLLALLASNVSLVSLRLGRHGAATARLQMGAVPREPERP